MANAAAKKAAAAREAAATTYFPIIIAINAIYLSLRLFYQSNPFTLYNVLATVSLIGLSILSYQGILADHANTMSSSKVGGSSEALAGGASLDLLGLVVLVQYGTIFVSEKLYWLLGLIPLWGGWKIYTTFFGSKGGAGGGGGFMSNNNQGDSSGGSAEDKMTAEKLNEKRQKRAERRRQKWS